MESFHVFGFAVIDIISVPGRKIDTKFKSLSFTGFREFFHHITLSIFPGSIFNTVFGGCRWPQTEAIVVFSRKNYSFKSGRLDRGNPLVAIQLSWIKRACRRITVTPFQIVECVQPKVYESVRFKFMPGNLFGCRNRIHCFRRRNIFTGKQGRNNQSSQ